MNERYTVVLLTDDGTGTGKMHSEVLKLATPTSAGYLTWMHLKDTQTDVVTGVYIRAVEGMNLMDLLFFGDSKRCAYVHRTQ